MDARPSPPDHLRSSPPVAALSAPLAAGAGQVHRRRVDDVDRAVGALRPPAADVHEEDRHRRQRRRARHRPGARHRPARRRRRRVRARPAAEEKFVAEGFGVKRRRDVMYNDFVLIGPKADPAKVARQQGHRRGAEEDRRREGAVRLARRQERHARRRAALLEARGRRPADRKGLVVSRDRVRAWGRRSTPRRR